MTDDTTHDETQQEAAANPKGTTRNLMRDIVNTQATRDKLEALLDRALDIRGLQMGYCPKCGSSVKVEMPDVTKQIAALREFLEQAEGKPAGEDTGVNINITRPPLETVTTTRDEHPDHARAGAEPAALLASA